MKTIIKCIMPLAGILIFACSKEAMEPKTLANSTTVVRAPYPDTAKYQGQKILVITYTGERCGYCPKSKVEIKMLEELFPNALLEVNAYTFVSLLSSATAEEFKTRNHINAFPTLQMGYNTYNEIALQYTAKPAAVLSNSLVKQNAGGTLEIDVSFEFLATLSKEMAVNIYLLEDSIPAEGELKQRDYLDLLKDVDDHTVWKQDIFSDSTGQLLFQENTAYLHRNVLTSSSEGNDLWGKRIAAGDYAKGDKLNLQFTVKRVDPDRPYRLLAILWRLENKSANQWQMVNGDFLK